MTNAQKTDDKLNESDVMTACYATADADSLIAATGTQDSTTKLTATYEKVEPVAAEGGDEDKGDGSIKITLGAATAAALMAFTF